MSANHSEGSRQLLAELESLLTQPSEPTRTEVEAAHGAATQAIRNVNERLSSVHQLIAAGRRAEGIEIAEGPPHVLDEIAILDSQLIRDWEHWAGQFGLPRFAPLRSDLASLLNGAYTAENQLEHLLRRHRLLAIGRANLRQRIAVLSQLAAADPSNPQWNKGLAHCQRVRLEQLSERSTRARKVRDLRSLQQVMAELRQTRWLTPVSKGQVQAVQKHIDLLQSRESTNEAIALSEHIQDAYAAGDNARLGPLIVRWREIESKIDPNAMPEVLPQIQSVVDWFEQEQQAERDAEAQCRALQRVASIQTGAQANEIRSVMEGIASTGAEVPVELQETYVERIREETRAKRLRAALITGAIAAVLLALTTVAAMAYRSYQNEAALAQMVEAVDAMLVRGDLDGAKNLLDSAPRNDDRFHDFREQLGEQQLKEKQRVDEFNSDADEILAAADNAQAVEEYSRLSIRASQLADRAQKGGEFATAKEVTEHVIARRDQRKNQVIGEAKQLLVDIRDGLETLVPDSKAKSTLANWNQKIQSARTDPWIRGESDLLIELDKTSNQIADRRESIRELAEIEKSLETITRSVGNWDRWESLGATADQYDAVVRGKIQAIADRTREERDLWTEIEQWNAIAPAWKVDQILSADRQQAQRIRPDLDKVQRARLSDLPAARDFIAACQVAMPMAARGRRTLETIVPHLQSAKMANINAVKIANIETSPAQWHYFPPREDSIAPRGDGFRLKYYTDLEMISLESGTFAFASVKVPAGFADNREDYLEGNRSLRAPHVQFCTRLLAQLNGLEDDPGAWDEVFVESYNQALELQQVDPIVQLFLATALLDVGSRGSWKFATAFAGHLQRIQDANATTNVNWIDPDDQDAAGAREQAATVLSQLRELGTVNPAPQLAKLKRSLTINTRYVPVGWLDQDRGRWMVRTGLPPDDGDLYVRFDGTDGNTTSRIGRLSGGQVALDTKSGPALRLGRPVWLSQPVSNTKAVSETRENGSR